MVGKLPAVKKDNQLDTNNIEKGTGHIPKRGYYYKTKGGNPVPSAWRVQEEANDFKISTEILESIVEPEYIEVKVRGHHPDGYYVEAIVRHTWAWIENQKVMNWYKKIKAGGNILMKVDKRNFKIKPFVNVNTPFFLDEYGNAHPNLSGEGQAKLIDEMLEKRIFGLQDCVTKAMRIVQEKLTNQDWREEVEKEGEEEEVKQVNGEETIEKETQAEVDEESAKKAEVEAKKEKAKADAKAKKAENDKQKREKILKEKQEKEAKKQAEFEKKLKAENEKKAQNKKDIIKQDDGSELETPNKKPVMENHRDEQEKEQKEAELGQEEGGIKTIPTYDNLVYKGIEGDQVTIKVNEALLEGHETINRPTMQKCLMTLKRKKKITNKQFVMAKVKLDEMFPLPEKEVKQE